MKAEVKVAEPKHSPELLSAVEKTLASHDLRLKPGETLEGIVDAFSAEQVKLNQSHGYLTAEMGSNPVHVAVSVEAFAAKQPQRFFPRDPSGVSSRDEMDRAAKIKFLHEHGIEKFEALPQSAPAETTVTLDHTRLTRQQWLSLDRTTRAELAGRWSPEIIGTIMSRKK